MNKENLLFYLERGNSFGYQTCVDDADYMGWVLIGKSKPNDRILEIFTPEYGLAPYDELLIEKNYPYHAYIAELKRSAWNTEKEDDNESYRRQDFFRFATFDELEQFLHKNGFKLQDIKWRADIECT